MVKAIDTFVEQSKQKLAALISNITKSDTFFNDPKQVEHSYHLLKQIRDSSAIFQLNEIYSITLFLLKQYQIQHLNYKLTADHVRIVKEGLHTLIKALISLDQFKGAHTSSHEKKRTQKVLIVDSDHFFVDWLINRTAQSEFDLIPTDGDSLFPALLKKEATLLIVNVMTEEGKGFEIIREIRENRWTSEIPILALTHSGDEKHHLDIIRCGVNGIIQKPFSIPLLLAHLKNLTNQKNRAGHYSPVQLENQRKEMELLIQKEEVRFQRYQSYYCLIYVKLDLFEKLIDTYGADSVLSYMFQFYHLVGKTIRIYDEIRQWNTSGFLLLLPATPLQGGVLVGNRIKQLAEQVKAQQNFSSHIIISVVQSEPGYRDVMDMIQRLEKEMTRVIPGADVHPLPLIYESMDVKSKQRRLKVLIIDDDPVPPTLIKNHLDPEEWEVDVCSDGANAFEYILEWMPDFVICETRMASLEGYSFCYQMRQFPQTRNLLFIFLSRQAMNKDIVRGFQVGADDYITKPFSAGEVEVRMRRLWKRLSERRLCNDD